MFTAVVCMVALKYLTQELEVGARTAYSAARPYVEPAFEAAQQAFERERSPPPAPGEEEVIVPWLGRVKGRVEADHRAFLGIPYAAPPVGEFRWCPPQPVEPRVSESAQDLPVYSATGMKPSCVQLRSHKQSAVEKIILGIKQESEDCLYLNVFTPRLHALKSATAKLPVLVFIHGGAFSTGGSAAPLYNPVDLMVNGLDKEAVVVTFDYRLGVFGYAAGAALLADSDDPVGNYGLQDQMAALQWVRENIRHFNGDPKNITVLGHSAGAMSASYLQLLRPDLADKWVLMSGTSFGWKWRQAGSDFENKIWCEMAARANCDPNDVACMRGVDATVLNNAAKAIEADYLFGPTIDNRLISTVPTNMSGYGVGPTIVTVVKDEASVFLGRFIRNERDYHEVTNKFFSHKNGLVQAVLDTYAVQNYQSAFNAANAALTDALFTCPAIRYHHHLSRQQRKVFLVQFDHPMLLSSVASRVVTGQDYGVFHGSDLVLLFNFSPFMSMPSGEQAAEMRSGLKRFMFTGSPLNSGRATGDIDAWNANQLTNLKGRGQCEAVWGLLDNKPPLPQNFGSHLDLQ